MTDDTATKWLKALYPHVKEASGLPPWLLPERSLNNTADEIGDSGLLTMSQGLGLANDVRQFLDNAPDPDTVSPQTLAESIKRWQHLPHIYPVVDAFMEIADTVIAQFQRIKQHVDPSIISRTLAVLLFAPFVTKGKSLLTDVAAVLNGDTADPAGLIRCYGQAVARHDIPVVQQVNKCLSRYNDWQRWAKSLEAQVRDCQYKPRLIAVTPEPSAELIAVLAMMFKEDTHESG